ncbi:uncharacterized protein Z518_08511 [Rhinocladiella mackenziei CBS 650.93]|uniref:Uncharacterized protein n=1 Tax=Rhinocladiella mackenziei CBS 650.93 TaxID=1442369 RepID=A0A0D2J135_9EURO|nr:uncharacterized protein Z518_08511 [Rhinocladiella mackenziei CBS 650.93]KIX02570.1 hypothetical protein Z518_08511 [Rhinocladiella mackenziei CBS 650.93]
MVSEQILGCSGSMISHFHCLQLFGGFCRPRLFDRCFRRFCVPQQWHRNISAADLQHVATKQEPNNGKGYPGDYQMDTANLWGELGRNLVPYITTFDDVSALDGNSVYTNKEEDLWGYDSVDLSPMNLKQSIVSFRTVGFQVT